MVAADCSRLDPLQCPYSARIHHLYPRQLWDSFNLMSASDRHIQHQLSSLPEDKILFAIAWSVCLVLTLHSWTGQRRSKIEKRFKSNFEAFFLLMKPSVCVCVYVHICVHVYVWVHAHECVYIWARDQNQGSSSISLQFVFWGRVSQWMNSSPVLLGRLASAPGILLSPSLQSGSDRSPAAGPTILQACRQSDA